MEIYKTHQGGLTSYVSFNRLQYESIAEAVGLKKGEKILGIYIEADGITVYIGM